MGGDGPYYVIDKNLSSNRLLVSNNKDEPALWKTEFVVTELSWTGKPPKLPLNAGVSIRYHHPDYPALITAKNDGNIHVRFEVAQRAITPGQSAVIYAGEQCLGGGVINLI